MRIMLACCAGMSTSLVVTKMQEAAKAQGKTDYKIWAIEESGIEQELGNFDVLLLGPQVRHILKKVTKLVDGAAPVALIDPVDYGRCNGAGVLKQAEELVGR
jgi:PTS system cellobiose-specific IIB component